MSILERVLLEDKIITISDAREKGGCVTGWKAFVEGHGFIWRDVVLQGLYASQLLALDDAMATELVEFVYNKDSI